MGKFKKCLIVTLSVVFTVLLTIGLAACKKDQAGVDARDKSIVRVYNAYVANAEEAGETPLSYEEWLKSIKGEKGSDGKDGADGKDGKDGVDGLSAYELYKKYHPVYGGTEEEWVEALASGKLAASYETQYNIIYTLATVPPVLSSLDAIKSGYETYAFIERGKTYNGISKLEKFHNIGFDIGSNKRDGFTAESFNKVLDTIKELNVFGNEKFNIYVQDGTALYATKFVANAMLGGNQYKIVMVEDGSGAYNALRQYVYSFDAFKTSVAAAKAEVAEIMSKTDNEFVGYYDIGKASALATLSNYEYRFQSKDSVKSVIEAANDADLMNAFGFGTETNEYAVNLSYGNVNDSYAALTESQKQDYLTLMYGDAYQGTYDALTRTVDVAGAAVPAKKLVFIGTRIASNPKTATSILGLGALSGEVPTWENLDAKYKNDLLFDSEENYNVLYNALYDDANFADVSDDLKARMRTACFNYYIDYVATLKFTYSQYGADYDIIMKGHPSEPMEGYDKWNRYYIDEVSYSKLMYAAITAFHNKESVGKRIGLMPYGTSAENLAYLGVEISIGGLSSSTYTGYDTSVDVNFVLSNTNGGITSDGNLKSRYEAGNLIYHTNDGEAKATKFFNAGLIYKTLAASENAEVSAVYTEKLNAWIKTVKGVEDASLYDVDDQGFIVEKTA